LTGAGISVSSNIPCFRGPTGLYNTLDAAEYKVARPEDIFEIGYFTKIDPFPFYKLFLTHFTAKP
jgi:NAD-dependent SIR2 family protein deacetylase